MRRDAQGLGIGCRLEAVSRAQKLQGDHSPAEDDAEDERGEQQRTDQAYRAQQHVNDRRRAHRLLDDLDDDRIWRRLHGGPDYGAERGALARLNPRTL